MKKIKLRYLWILFALLLILSTALVFLTRYINNSNASLAMLVVSFLVTSFVFQMALTRTFVIKQNKKLYNPRNLNFEYDEAVKSLREKKFSSHKFSYGTSFIKIIDNIAYKVIFVLDSDVYYSDEAKDESKGINTPGIDKCSKFIGFEIFINPSLDALDRLKDFTIETEKIFYEGFSFDVSTNILYEPNHIEPSLNFINEYNSFKEILGISTGE